MTYLVTYNMQGGGNWVNVGPMLSGLQVPNPNNPYQSLYIRADVLCLQECGSPPDPYGAATVVDAANHVNTLDYRGSKIYWVEWGNANNRCSLAVVTPHTITKWHVMPVGAHLRPLLGLKISFPGRAKSTWVYSGHMPSGNHNFASACAYDAIMSGQFTGDWILAGDFNCTPAEFTNPPGGRAWVATDGAPVHSGGATHQGGNTLDYAVSPKVALTYFATQLMSSDHAAVWFNF